MFCQLIINKTWATVQWKQTCCKTAVIMLGILPFKSDNWVTFHFYYLRNTSVHIVDGSAWPSQRDGTAYNSEPSKSQWQIWVLCGHWADTLNIDTIRFDGTRVVRVGIEKSTLVCSLNGFWIFPTWKLSVTACHTYTLLTQFNSFLTVTPIYALDETLDVKVVKHCHC